RCTTRHLALSIPLESTTGPSSERDDPREGSNARAGAFRELGVLRQAHPRPPRSVESALVARHAHVRSGTERGIACELLGVADRLFAVGRRSADRGRSAGLLGRGEVLWRRILIVSVSLS